MINKLFDLTGKVCVVTGGNKGIGLGMAEGLASAGAQVVIWGTNDSDNRASAQQLRAKGWVADSMRVDVSDEEQITASMAEVNARFGRLDTVIANAGISRPAESFLEMDTNSWREVMSVKLDGVFWTLREGARYMVERAKAGEPGGSLAVTASMGALFGSPRNESYSASKAAVILLVKSIAVEFARYGIRANAILPGWADTDMTARLKHEKFEKNVIGRVPMRRWANKDEFRGIAVYLASDAASFHTGDAILIDGGYAAF